MADPILLRPWSMDDLEALLGIFATSEDLVDQFPYPVTTLAEARELVTSALACDDTAKTLAITVADQPVGQVAITHIEHRHDTAWVSYFSAAAVRGRGFVTRATIAAANWALTDLGVFRLELGHRVNNPASGAVARAAGFRPEGLERQKLRYGTDRYDVRTYARLVTDPVPRAIAVTLSGV